MPERICAYRAHAKHREIHKQRLKKLPPRPDYQHKVGVPVNQDKSDDRTFYGRVVFVRRCGFGSQVFSNRGTVENPYFEVHNCSTFGAVAKEWLNDKKYKSADLSQITVAGLNFITRLHICSHQYFVSNIQGKYYMVRAY